MLNDTLRVLLRRWILVVLAVDLAVLLGLGAYLATPLQYQSQAQVLFLPPIQQPGVEGKVNPFLALGASLGVTADIVRIDVTDDDSRAALVKQGALLDYEVTPYLAQGGGPILIVTVEGNSAASTQRTITLVAAAVATDLRDIQRAAKAPVTSFISATKLTATPEALPVRKDRIRAAAVAGAGSLILLLGLILVVDRVSGWRRRRAVRRAGEAADRSRAADAGWSVEQQASVPAEAPARQGGDSEAAPADRAPVAARQS